MANISRVAEKCLAYSLQELIEFRLNTGKKLRAFSLGFAEACSELIGGVMINLRILRVSTHYKYPF